MTPLRHDHLVLVCFHSIPSCSSGLVILAVLGGLLDLEADEGLDGGDCGKMLSHFSALTDIGLQRFELTLDSSSKWLPSHSMAASLGLVWKSFNTYVSEQDFRANTEQKDSA